MSRVVRARPAPHEDASCSVSAQGGPLPARSGTAWVAGSGSLFPAWVYGASEMAAEELLAISGEPRANGRSGTWPWEYSHPLSALAATPALRPPTHAGKRLPDPTPRSVGPSAKRTPAAR